MTFIDAVDSIVQSSPKWLNDIHSFNIVDAVRECKLVQTISKSLHSIAHDLHFLQHYLYWRHQCKASNARTRNQILRVYKISLTHFDIDFVAYFEYIGRATQAAISLTGQSFRAKSGSR